MRLSATAAVVALWLSACSFVPTYQRPEAPVAPQWPTSGQAQNIDGGSVGSAGSVAAIPREAVVWRDFFTDGPLVTLIETALKNNRDLRVALLNVEQAGAALGVRRADLWPTLNGALGATRAATANGATTTTLSAGLTVTAYEFDLFGRVSALQEQAAAQLLATREASQSVQISLISAVAQSWLSLLADEELLAISRETLATREKSLELVTLRFSHGASSELDLRQAQSLREAARVTLAQQERQRALDENSLTLLLGQALPPNVRSDITQRRLAQVALPDVPAGLPADLLTRRPDIRQAEQLLQASNASIGAARAAFFPRITLTASAGSVSSELSGLFKDGSWGFSVAPQLLQPLFDSGRNQANLDASQAGFNLAVAQYEKSIQTAFREVSDALASRSTLQRQWQAQQAQTEAEAGRLRLIELRYQNGASSQLDWLDAQRSYFANQQALVQVRQAWLQSQINLYKALGGGVSAP